MVDKEVNKERMWYCNNGNTCYGPISIEELRQLALRRAFGSSDLLWRKGLVGWANATKIEELQVDSVSLYELHTLPDKRINLGDILEARVSVCRNIPEQLQPYVSLNLTDAELPQLRPPLSRKGDTPLVLGFQLVGRPRFRDWVHCLSSDRLARDDDGPFVVLLLSIFQLYLALFRVGLLIITAEITIIFVLTGTERYFRWLRSAPLNLFSQILQWFLPRSFIARFCLFAAVDGNKIVFSCDGKRAQCLPRHILSPAGIWSSLHVSGHGGTEIKVTGVSRSYFDWLTQLAAEVTAPFPKGAPPLVVSAPAISGPVSPPDLKVDVNSAPVEALADLPGIGAILARKAFDIREQTGGFVSLESFAEALGLKPHIIERIRTIVVVGPVSEAPAEVLKGRMVDF